MKIRDIRATPVNIPLTAPYRFSYGSIASLTKTVVEVLTEDGVTGLGEIADGNRSAEVAALRERLLGLDIRDLNTAERRCVPAMRYTPWGNAIPLRRAFGGIEMALWDARGRAEGVPLSLLLGGAVREQVAVTEYFSYRLPGASDPGEGSPVEVARYCARMIERFDSVMFEGKVATVALDEEVAMVREVRAAIGERALRLDANGAWTVPTAREALRRLDPFMDAAMRIGGEAPGRRAHSSMRHESHRKARVTATSDRHRQPAGEPWAGRETVSGAPLRPSPLTPPDAGRHRPASRRWSPNATAR